MSSSPLEEQYQKLEKRYESFYTPAFRLRFGGRTQTANDYTFPPDGPQVRETNGLVSGLSVESSLDGAGRFSWTLVGVYDLEDAKFDETVWRQFAPQTAVRIEVGYGSRLVPVLEGRIQSLRPEFPAGGVPTIDVSGFDRLHDTTRPRGPESRDWSKVRLAEVIDDVLTTGEYGYTGEKQRHIVDLKDLSSPFEKIVQEGQSDFEFMDQWAKWYNYELFVHVVPDSMNRDVDTDATAEPDPESDGGYEPRFKFRPPADGTYPALRLEYGKSLQSFSVEVNEASQPSSVTVRSWDGGGRRRKPIEESYPEETEDTRKITVPVESPEQARLAAKAAYERTEQERVTGRGELIGLPTIRVGQVLDVRRLSEQVNAEYYVTGVTHRVDESGYNTSINVRLADEETIELE